MTVGGWPLAGKADIGDDHSLAYPGFLAGVPLVRPGEFGGLYVCELLVSLPVSSA
jgi:hypothetical protein